MLKIPLSKDPPPSRAGGSPTAEVADDVNKTSNPHMSLSSPSNKLPIWSFAILGLAVVAFGVWRSAAVRGGAEFTEPQWATVQAGAIESAFFFSGELQYRQQVRLSSQVVGQIKRIHVNVGDRVTAGQLLITVDDAVLRADLFQAQTQAARGTIERKRLEQEVNLRTGEWQRADEIWRLGLRTREQADSALLVLENARYALNSSREAEAQEKSVVEQRQLLLTRTEIRAPISATVISLPLKEGETALPSAQSIAGSDLAVLAEPNSLQVEALISEHDISRFKLGQETRVTPVTNPAQALAGKVVYIGSQAFNQGSNANGGKSAGGKGNAVRRVMVRVALNQPTEGLISGTSADVSLLASSASKGPVIPIVALQFKQEEDPTNITEAINGGNKVFYVWKDVQGSHKRQNVRLGLADANHQLVVEGLVVGDRVLTGPASLLAQLRKTVESESSSAKRQ